MELTDEAIKAANQRAARKKAEFPATTAVRYERGTARLVVSLSSGVELSFSPDNVQGLEGARPVDLMDAEISPSGLGIRFPRLDADVYVPALIEGLLGSRRWMASRIGREGGKVSTAATVAAARANGRLGGRPAKQK